MVGGFNTNVRYNGRMFHVQTEHSGESSPQVQTLLYEGGAILYSQKCSYERDADGGIAATVRTLMEQQHLGVLESLRGGELDDVLNSSQTSETGAGTEEPPTSFGEGVITERPLDEVIVDHLSLE